MTALYICIGALIGVSTSVIYNYAKAKRQTKKNKEANKMTSNVILFYLSTIKKAVEYNQQEAAAHLLHLTKVEQSVVDRITLYKNTCQWCSHEAIERYICIMDLISAIDKWHEDKSNTRMLKRLADNVCDGTAFMNQFYKELGYSDAASGRQAYGAWAGYLDILLIKLRENF